MTRAEKFKEVFGLKMNVENADCGFFDCSDIESCANCPVLYTEFWWNGEYEVPSQPQDGDRAISLNAVLEKAGYTETEEGWCGYTVDVDYIKSLPPVNPQEPKTGHWIPIYQGDEIINYECSECKIGDTNGSTMLYRWHYCRRCGARMVNP